MSEIRLMSQAEALESIPALSRILMDCVDDGASVGFMAPLKEHVAEDYWSAVADGVGSGQILLFSARVEGEIVGTVQVGFASKPNQPHRGDLMKLLVHRKARGLGLSRTLMAAAEAEAAARGRWLLVLDTATGEFAEGLYAKYGWTRSGVIPNYALYPDGRYCATTVFFKDLREAEAA